jgi:polyisoprenyl-phosphate glycosyltransferase
MELTVAQPLDDACIAEPFDDALLVSIVIPVFRNRETLPALVRRLQDIATRFQGRMEAVFVIDGSPDDSGAVLRALLAGADLRSQLLWHSRNFGAFAAVRTGLAAARGRWMMVMSADLQEPTDLLIDFYEALATGDYDVAVGVRKARHDPLMSRLGASWFWSIYCRWVQRDMPRGGVDVFACTDRVRDALQALGESNSSLVGLLVWLGYRRIEVAYTRAPREIGRSSWTLRKKVRYLLDSIYSFTDLPINMLLAVGVTGVLLSSAAALIVFLGWALVDIHVAGYTPIMLTLLISGSAVLSGLGIVGSYVWRTYENSKHRPHAVAMLSETFGDADEY